MIPSVRPRPRPKPSRGLGLPGLAARASTFGSLSPQKPGLSHGFQAEPSPHITTCVLLAQLPDGLVGIRELSESALCSIFHSDMGYYVI